MRTAMLILSLLLSFTAAAEVYKWTDDKGVVHYTDKPPKKGAKPAELPPLQSYRAPTPSIGNRPSPDSAGADSAAPAAVKAKVSVQIVSPSADETYHGANDSVPVAVVVSPGLDGGKQLRYFLDGAAQGGPTASTSQTFSSLERGSHDIAVAVLDPSGRELARSSVTVHMMPPTVKRR